MRAEVAVIVQLRRLIVCSTSEDTQEAATELRSPQREEHEAVLLWRPRPGLQPPGRHQHRGHGEHGGQAAHPHRGREDAEDVEGGDVAASLLGPPDLTSDVGDSAADTHQ